MWEGKTVAVIATGPSLTRKQVDAVRDLPCIAVNDNAIDVLRDGVMQFAMAPWADLLYAADYEWWAQYPQARAFPGLKVTCMDSAERLGVLVLEQTGTKGFDPNPSCIRTGGNSGYQAVHVAIHAKAKRILLLGFDMHAKNGAHWFGRHPPRLRNTEPESYPGWVERFEALKGRGSEIINCTPGSALRCFPSETL